MALKVSSLLRSVSFAKNTHPRFFSFKSDLSLDKIYGTTKVEPFTPPKSIIDGKFTGYIPIEELKITYTKASGPGGQHVNKTATKADVRFHVQSAKWISEETKQKLMEKFATRINKEGYFVMKSEKTKEALINRSDAVSRIRDIIYKLEEVPEPLSEEKLEKMRKNKEKSIRMRMMEKRATSLLKRRRRGEDL